VKEIDFLPEWYKNGKRRQIGYRTQYAVLGGVLVVMVVWGLVATYLVSKTGRELAAAQPKQREAELVSQEFDRIQSQVTELQEKADIIAGIDSRINVANVLAELSFLIDEKVVLSRVEMVAERFVEDVEDKGVTDRRASVRVASGRRRASEGGQSGPPRQVRFKVVINGMAVDAGHVAELISKLEDSPYFCLVYPSFSRNSQIKEQMKRSAAGENDQQLPESYQVSEFEISCYLANYRRQGEHLAEEPQPGKGSVQENS
jgi:hypothetical protein